MRVIVPPTNDGARTMSDHSYEHITFVGMVDASGGRLPPSCESRKETHQGCTMLPNCTAVCQPLDVGVFASFKHILRNTIRTTITHGHRVTRDNIMTMIYDAWFDSFTHDNIRHAWRHAGMATFGPIPDTTTTMPSDRFAPETRAPYRM